tara:strand:+ start:632 stop:958 length:327 start_codon:yes stop_codon:yes gene_type:complete
VVVVEQLTKVQERQLHLQVVLVVEVIAKVDKAQETLHQYHLHKEIQVDQFLQVVDLRLVLVVVELVPQVAIIAVQLVVLAEQVFKFHPLSAIHFLPQHQLLQDKVVEV